MKKRILPVILAALMMLSALPVSTAFAFVLGDVDGDGEPTSSDARLALRYSVHLEELNAEQLKAADVDLDSTVTSSDARLILRASVGLEDLHSHSYAPSVTKAASCTENGVRTYSCSCGDFYTESIPATGHLHSSLDAATVKTANCGEAGYTGDYKCDVCGTVTESGTATPVNENVHSVENVTLPPSCTEDGYTRDECKFCDYFDSMSIRPTGATASGHNYGTPVTVPPTCTERGYTVKRCACGDEIKYDYVDEKGHKYSWTVTKDASCKETGSRDGVCSGCGVKVTEEIPFAPCTLVTAFVHGKENTLCKYVTSCSVCHTIISERNAEDYEHVIPVSPPSPATCTTSAYVKARCQFGCYRTIEEYPVSEPLGHKAQLDSTRSYDATCTDPGLLAYTGTCERCGNDVDDSDVVIPAKGHKLTGVQTCTTSVYCTVKGCGAVTAPALGHDYTIPAAVSAYGADTPAFFCNRCGKEADNSAETFNGVTNLIKTLPYASSQNNTVSFFDKTTVKTEYSRFDFGIYTNSIKNMYEKEMANTPDEFSHFRKNYNIRSYLPVTYNHVSEIELADTDSIRIEKLSGLKVSDVLSAYPDSYTIGNTSYNVADYKNTTVDGNVIKVTIDVKDEKFFGGVQNLDGKTSLQKLFNLDIREEANGFKNKNGEFIMQESDSGDGYEITMDMRLQQITSDATVVYYFKADTYEPILAIYNTSIRMEQTIAMKFKIGLFSLNGELDPIITTDTARIYFFSGVFG